MKTNCPEDRLCSPASLRLRARVGNRLDVDLQLGSGCTAIVGSSGAGKTTLLHVVAGLVRADPVEVRVGERVLDSSKDRIRLPPERRGAGLQFQDGRLFPHLTVRGNLAYPLQRGRGTVAAPRRCAEALGIEALLDRPAALLSGGEVRRTALARALAAAEDLLLLDEPLGGLDDGARERILPWLRRVVRGVAVPTLLVTHSISEALFLADRVVVLEAGRVVADGSPLEVLPSRTVVSSMREEDAENLLAGVVRDDGRSVRVGRAVLRVASEGLEPGAEVAVRLRAGDVIVGLSRHGDLSARNALEGRVKALHPVQDGVLAYVDVGALLVVSLTRAAVRELKLGEGLPVVLYVKTTAVRIATTAKTLP